ncbi:MAG: hypothetical protein AB8F95_03690 [Bacteroidia bacterium]
MAKSKKPRVRIQKYINYVKEAFFWPVHLVGLTILTAITVIGAAAAPTELASLATIMLGGGLELLFLGFISNNPRFVRAINAKYQGDIDAFYKTKSMVEYYNALSHTSQSRFDKLRDRVKDVRDNYKKLSMTPSSTMVDSFIKKLNAIETSYVRLLYFKDKFPSLANEDGKQKTVSEIDKLNQELKSAKGRLKEIKEKRMRLLRLRMDNYTKVKENRDVIEEQLQTIEEMVEYIKDQPMTLRNTEREDIMIDNLLFFFF